jgi:hypothetical protein
MPEKLRLVKGALASPFPISELVNDYFKTRANGSHMQKAGRDLA